MPDDQVQQESPTTLKANVWFSDPNSRGFLGFIRSTNKQGVLTITNNMLTLMSDEDGTQVVNQNIDSVVSVKRRAPLMTFNFSDGSKLQVDFQNPYQARTDMAAAAFGSKTGLENMPPFEKYFQDRGLLPS